MTRLGFFRAPIDLYKLDQNGRVDSPPQIVTCEDDDAALIEARKYVDAHAFEIWFREQASWIDPTRRVRPPQMALFHSGLTSPSVKVFGCRPHEGGAAHTGAGVRKPPREETAGGARGWRGVGYGDLSAADDVSDWS